MSDRRILAAVKSNLSALAPPLAFRLCARCPACRNIVNGETCAECRVRTTGSIEWLDAPDRSITADAVLAEREPVDAAGVRRAEDFLREVLKDGEVDSSTIHSAAKREGIAKRTLDRAKALLNVVSRHEGQPGKSGRWLWSMPSKPVPPKSATGSPTKDVTPGNVAFFEQPREKTDETAITSPKDANPEGMASFDGTLRARIVAHLASIAPRWLTAAEIASALGVAAPDVAAVLTAVVAEPRNGEPRILFRGAGSTATPYLYAAFPKVPSATGRIRRQPIPRESIRREAVPIENARPHRTPIQ